MHPKKNGMTIPVIGYLCAIGATIMWSGNFIVARSAVEQMPPVGLAFWRWATAAILLAPFALKQTLNRLSLVNNHFRYLSFTALVGITAVNTLTYIAGRSTSAMNLSLIAISAPIFIILLSRIIYGERIHLTRIIGLVISISGVLLLITNGSISRLIHIQFAHGDLIMLLAAFLFAGYSILVKELPKELPHLVFLFTIFVLGALFLFPFFLWECLVVQQPDISKQAIISILYVAIFASLFSYVLWNKAIVTIGPSKSALIYYMIPVFSGISSRVILKESIGIVQSLSMLVIIIGILTANKGSVKGQHV
jgi:drug/metabolite transporter (DMT)-like permease